MKFFAYLLLFSSNVYWVVLYFLIAFLSGSMASKFAKNTSMACNIFCSGNILHDVQMARIFNDSKHFVDLKMKSSPQEIEKSYLELKEKSKDSLTKFVETHFEQYTFQTWQPDDWQEKPKFIEDIYDINLKEWAYKINSIWTKLGRQFDDDVSKNNSLYSYIYLPKPFIVPGGRFNELYYWDSYWIIEGLLLSEMYTTAENMILNFIHLVKEIGYVPNGNRKYYLGRSQPPMLIPMVDLYYKATRNKEFLKQNVPILEKEFNFWLQQRSSIIVKDGLNFVVFQYKDSIKAPRPESYYEDVHLVQKLPKQDQKKVYASIRSAAETGWDFSSRWMQLDYLKQNISKHDDLTLTDTESVVPVCLNSIMSLNAKILSEFYDIIGDSNKTTVFSEMATTLNKTMTRFFWNNDKGMWFDYNLKSKTQNTNFYPSNLMPLWSESYGLEYEKSYIVGRVLSYLKKENVLFYPGGIPTSLLNTSQQWDFPNGWAPLQYFSILGLEKAKHINNEAAFLAFNLAKNWTLNCYKTFLKNDGIMYEKYDVTHPGKTGGGGEYAPQEGFGWTNGVVLKFLSLYRHKIRVVEVRDPFPAIIGLVILLVSLICVVSYLRRFHSEYFRRRFRTLFCKKKMHHEPETIRFHTADYV